MKIKQHYVNFQLCINFHKKKVRKVGIKKNLPDQMPGRLASSSNTERINYRLLYLTSAAL